MQAQLLDADYILVNGKPVVRLFGKTEVGESICAMVEGVMPYFFLFPKPEIELKDIEYELDKNGLDYEVVEKFLPIGWSEKTAKILKIIGRDPSKIPEVRAWASKFGTAYEADVLFKNRYMVDAGLCGMSWFEFKGNQVTTSTVKCKTYKAEDMKPIDKLENAPLKYLSIDIECANPSGLPNAENDPIIMISLVFSQEWRGLKEVVLVARQTKLPGCIGCNDEQDMLRKFLDILHGYDPDIITGYNIENFDMPYILTRLGVLKMQRDLGRSDKPAFSKKLQYTQRTSIIGRVIIDPYYIIKHLSVYDQPLRLKRFDLRTVAKVVLGAEKLQMDGASEIMKLWKGSQNDLKRLAEYSQRDAELAMQLITSRKLVDMDKFIEIAKLSGLLLQDVMSGQAARHEQALLRELGKRGFIMPCKPDSSEMRRRADNQLKGALVLEPETGLHAKGCVLVLDFTALYPSLICAYNICPTTLITSDTNVECQKSPIGARFVSKNIREGIFPQVARYYLNTRKEVRKKMRGENDPERLHILDAKQYALKGMAVSLYGYTAFAAGRMFTPDVAAAITSWGRENIENTRNLIESNFPVKVIYGDTDSMFVKTDITDLDAATALGENISSFVTERLSGLELKFEKIFKSFLIETKKRYAGLSTEKKDGKWVEKLEMKGIETVRRDWCVLTTETMNHVLDIILREGDIKKATRYVRDILTDMAAGKIPIEKLAVVKGITKDIESYDGVQPHVELAKKLVARDSSRGNMIGERLEYVIIKGNALLSKRAEDPEFVKQNGLEIDSRYYIENQILPPLERIFEACGVTKTELVHGTKQMSLLAALNGQKPVLSPENTVLSNYEAIVCKKCDWSFRRPTLTGVCPSCGGHLYFSSGGSIGKFIDPKK